MATEPILPAGSLRQGPRPGASREVAHALWQCFWGLVAEEVRVLDGVIGRVEIPAQVRGDLRPDPLTVLDPIRQALPSPGRPLPGPEIVASS